MSLEACVGVLQAKDRAEAFQAEPHGRECCLWSSGDSSQRLQPRSGKEGREAGGLIVKGEQRVSHQQSPEPPHPPRAPSQPGLGMCGRLPSLTTHPGQRSVQLTPHCLPLRALCIQEEKQSRRI